MNGLIIVVLICQSVSKHSDVVFHAAVQAIQYSPRYFCCVIVEVPSLKVVPTANTGEHPGR